MQAISNFAAFQTVEKVSIGCLLSVYFRELQMPL